VATCRVCDVVQGEGSSSLVSSNSTTSVLRYVTQSRVSLHACTISTPCRLQTTAVECRRPGTHKVVHPARAQEPRCTEPALSLPIPCQGSATLTCTPIQSRTAALEDLTPNPSPLPPTLPPSPHLCLPVISIAKEPIRPVQLPQGSLATPQE
jgi:hypothetical protein